MRARFRLIWSDTPSSSQAHPRRISTDYFFTEGVIVFSVAGLRVLRLPDIEGLMRALGERLGRGRGSVGPQVGSMTPHRPQRSSHAS